MDQRGVRTTHLPGGGGQIHFLQRQTKQLGFILKLTPQIFCMICSISPPEVLSKVSGNSSLSVLDAEGVVQHLLGPVEDVTRIELAAGVGNRRRHQRQRRANKNVSSPLLPVRAPPGLSRKAWRGTHPNNPSSSHSWTQNRTPPDPA